jgi:hypothetical protein
VNWVRGALVFVDVKHVSTRCLLGLAAAAAVLVAGCGGDEPEPAAAKDQRPAPTSATGSTSSTSDAKPTKPYTVEQLAAVLGCKPEFQGKAKDFRQANCVVDGDPVVLVQFDKESGQEDWLEYATRYGGVYLSGDRWVLSGKSEEWMESLRQKLGGTIEERR